MKIDISTTERHPLPGGTFKAEENPTHLVLIFGIAKRRGDNVVFSTRVTDAFYDVLKKYNLTYHATDTLQNHHAIKRLAISQGLNFDSIGIAKNLRQILNPEQYGKLVTELCASISLEDVPKSPKTKEEPK